MLLAVGHTSWERAQQRHCFVHPKREIECSLQTPERPTVYAAGDSLEEASNGLIGHKDDVVVAEYRSDLGPRGRNNKLRPVRGCWCASSNPSWLFLSQLTRWKERAGVSSTGENAGGHAINIYNHAPANLNPGSVHSAMRRHKSRTDRKACNANVGYHMQNAICRPPCRCSFIPMQRPAKQPRALHYRHHACIQSSRSGFATNSLP